MKIAALILTGVSFFTLASCRVVPHFDIIELAVKRDELPELPVLGFNLMARANNDIVARGIISDVLESFNVTDLLDSINIESIAGWINSLLNSNNITSILDDLLIGLKDTNVVPNLLIWVLGNNFTREIVADLLPPVLKFVGGLNTTGLFVALDRSGLAYQVVAGALEDPTTYTAVLDIVKKLIKSNSISLSDIFADVEQLFTRDEIWEEFNEKYRRDLIMKGLNDEKFQALVRRDAIMEIEMRELTKRDNVNDLLTTIFASVARSGLVTETLHVLLSSDKFQDEAVSLIVGVLHNLGSLNGTDFSSFKPLLTSLWDSGLLQHTIESALGDPTLLKAVVQNVVGLLSNGTISKRDILDDEELLQRDDVRQILGLTSLQVKV